MSDSGRRIGECEHGVQREWCIYCLRNAIMDHHFQKADDRCIEDDYRLYATMNLPMPDIRVGDKFAMAQNCMRFIERRCEGGGWPSYVELEQRIEKLREAIASMLEMPMLIREWDDECEELRKRRQVARLVLEETRCAKPEK